VEVSMSAVIIGNLAHAYRIIVSFPYLERVAIYLLAWAIVVLFADGSFHNLYPIIGNSSTPIHKN